MGRPTDAPKENNYKLRLTNADLEMLNWCSEVSGKPKSEILRMGIHLVCEQLKK